MQAHWRADFISARQCARGKPLKPRQVRASSQPSRQHRGRIGIARHPSRATLRAGLCPSPWTDRQERPGEVAGEGICRSGRFPPSETQGHRQRPRHEASEAPAGPVPDGRPEDRPRRAASTGAGSGSPVTRLGRPFGPGLALRPGLIGRSGPERPQRSAKAAPARKRMGNPHAEPLPPIKEEVTGISPPITRRAPDWQASRRPWRIFRNHRPANSCH